MGKHYQPQLVSQISSINSMTILLRDLNISNCQGSAVNWKFEPLRLLAPGWNDDTTDVPRVSLENGTKQNLQIPRPI